MIGDIRSFTLGLLLVLLLFSPVSATTYTAQYPGVFSTTTVKVTTIVDAGYQGYYAIDPSKLVTGAGADNSWLANAYTNQKLNVDLGSEKIIRMVNYSNYQWSGIESWTLRGVKTYKLYGTNSATAFASTTYSDTTDLTELSVNTSQFAQHSVSDSPDWHYISINNSVAYRYYVFRFADGYSASDYMGVRRITLYTEDGYSPPDTTPPASITDLQNTTTCENVTFTWTNPLDSDYSHLYNLFDNVAQTNKTNSTTSASFTPLAGTHTFSTKTVDLSGNMNATWVNQSVVISACPTPTPTPTPTPGPTFEEEIPVYSTQWCGLQNIYFVDKASDISGYHTLLNFPTGTYNADENVTVTSADNPKLIDSYLSSSGSPGNTLLLAGLRQYNMYGYVSSVSQPSYYTFNVSILHQNGTFTHYYNTTSTAISSTSATMDKTYAVVNSNVTFSSTDRLLIQIYGYTTRTSSTTIHFVNGGTTTASYKQTGYFVCPASTCCVPTTSPAASLPYVVNPTTDKKTDWVKLITDWWWAGFLVLIVIWILSSGGRK